MSQAVADKNNVDITSEKFIPGGCKQKALGHMAAKEIRINPDCYTGASPDKNGFATRMSAVGMEAAAAAEESHGPWARVRYQHEPRVWYRSSPPEVSSR